MIALLGAVGWGLLAIGSITHIWHHDRLRDLLAMHVDHERLPALVLTVVEAALAVALPAAFLTNHRSLVVLAMAGLMLALGFMGWIARLLRTGSKLPCACSFSTAPTTVWSLARSACVGLVALFAVVSPADLSTANAVAVMATGAALSAAIFVVPEAIAWPSASKALLARVDAYDPANSA